MIRNRKMHQSLFAIETNATYKQNTLSTTFRFVKRNNYLRKLKVQKMWFPNLKALEILDSITKRKNHD